MKEYAILIVDDSEADRYILKRFIRDTNQRPHIHEAANGHEALEFLRDYEVNKTRHGDKFPPVIIFLDINMPRVSGFEFLEEFDALRAQTVEYQPVVIMMFSSSEKELDRARALSRDFVKGFLVKGRIESEQLEQMIQGIISAS